MDTQIQPNQSIQTPISPTPPPPTRNVFRGGNKKRLTLIVVLIILAIAIPLTIFLNQQEQDLRQRASGGVACKIDTSDTILVIDSSNSMQGTNLSSAKTAAINFAHKMLTAHPNNRVGIASFDDHGGLRQGLTTSETAVKNAINALSTPGQGHNGTCLECAIDRDSNTNDVAGAFASTPNGSNSRQVIILTDGKINRYSKPDGSVDGGNTNAEELKARDQALGKINAIKSTYNATFWTIHYDGSGTNASYLQTISGSPTRYFLAPNPAQWESIYTKIANELLGNTIVAYVFDDLNNNGAPDNNEPPLKDVNVTLSNGTVSVNPGTTTAINPRVAFTSDDRNVLEEVKDTVVKPAYAACSGNRDCRGGQPYCVNKSCVECRNPGSKNDCNNNKVCNSNHKCVAAPTVAPTVPVTQPTNSTPPPTGNEPLTQTKPTQADGKATFENLCAPSYTLEVTPPAGYTGTSLKQVAQVVDGQVVTKNFPMTKEAGATTAVCTPSSITLSDNFASIAATFKDSAGQPLVGKEITWTKTNNSYSLGPTTPADGKTDANGTSSTMAGISLTSDAAPFTDTITASFAGTTDAKAASCTVAVTYGGAKTPTLNFTGDPTTVQASGSSMLKWTTENVTSCTASEGWSGTKTASGSESTGPLDTTTKYTLTCSGENGQTVTKTVTINVGGGKATLLNLSILLHGLGASGDNVLPRPEPCQRSGSTSAGTNEECLSNQKPLHPTRDIQVEILDKNNIGVKTATGAMTYDNAYGGFKTSIDLGSDWTTGTYNIKVKTPMFLQKQVPGFQNIVANQVYDVPEIAMVSSDVDGDNRLTILDYNLIVECYTFPGFTPSCPKEKAEKVDVNDNGVNDEFDENLFIRDLSVQYGD